MSSVEIPLDEARVGVWVRFTVDEPITDETDGILFSKGVHVKQLKRMSTDSPVGGLFEVVCLAAYDEIPLAVEDETGCAYPLVFRRHGRVWATRNVRDVHVYQGKPDANPEPSGEYKPDFVPVTDFDQLQYGDMVRFHSGSTTITGMFDMFTDDDHDAWKLAGDYRAYMLRDGFTFDDATRRLTWTKDDLPSEQGFYKAATGSVWKWDGKHWSPVIDHEGNPAKAAPRPLQGIRAFFESSVKANRFPFRKVELQEW